MCLAFKKHFWSENNDRYAIKTNLDKKDYNGSQYLIQAWERDIKEYRELYNKIVRLKEVKKNKPCINGKFTESLDYVYYHVFFDFFDCEGSKYREMFHCMGC